MRNAFFTRHLLVLSLLLSSFSFAAEKKEEQDSPPQDLKTEIKAYITHHLQDAHTFSLFSYTNTNGEHQHVGFPLPIILWDNGLQVFSSSKFHHGETLAQINGNSYTLHHGNIYKTNAQGTLTYNEEQQLTNPKPLDLSITKNVVTIALTGLLMLWLFTSLAKSYAKNNGIPTGVGRFLEPIVLYIRDDIARPNIGETRYKKYMPFLLTVFFFIWFLNLLGITPLGVNLTGNIAITFALAVITFVITNLTGTKDYWSHQFNPLGNAMPWYAKIPLYIILVPIEILGMFIKPFSLLIRLYANMQAGHIILMSLIGLMFIFKSWIGSSLSFLLTFALALLELFVALLQAYIFTMLSALYFGFASEDHHEKGHENDPELVHL